jgi:DNA mismatch endonuclease (patch repair protein)
VVDVLSPEQRHRCMARVKAKDTTPERVVRSTLHRLGFRFKLHSSALPGRPDVVMPKYRTVVFVHGCFWHGHKRCARATRPSSNVAFWNRKLDGNEARDARVQCALRDLGWTVLVVWECQTREADLLLRQLSRVGRAH